MKRENNQSTLKSMYVPMAQSFLLKKSGLFLIYLLEVTKNVNNELNQWLYMVTFKKELSSTLSKK